MKTRSLGLALFAVCFVVEWASAQGLIVDRRRNVPIRRSYQIKELRIDGRVEDQVAEVQVSQTFHNPGSFQLEAEYLFPLPEGAAIRDVVLLVDGKELPGKVLPKDEARRIYERIVRQKQDPALLEYMGRGLFRTSVFPIPPKADRRVTLRYTQLCKKTADSVEFLYPFSTQKHSSAPIQSLSFRLRIKSSQSLKAIFCPSHQVQIERPNNNEASVRLSLGNVVPTKDLRIVATMQDGPFGVNLISHRDSDQQDGYFVLLASPEVEVTEQKRVAKNVLFVLDRSGSMSGKKLEQAKGALKFVLNNLYEEDLFNIVDYDDRVESFRPELARYGDESRAAAVNYVDNIYAGGSTNIDAALKRALAMVHDDSRPNYIIFLTDGKPTAGEKRELQIAENCKNANKHRARIFVFGVGHGVNARLLDRLSSGNSGTSEYVKPDEDIEKNVSSFYSKLTMPALTRIQLELTGTDVNRTYPRDLPDLFRGGQLVWVGRYSKSGKTNIRLSGRLAEERRTFVFNGELASAGENGKEFVAHLWASRRIGNLIDQIDLHGQNDELIGELVSLSKRYGILTPYTSILADETTLFDVTGLRSRVRANLGSLNRASGDFGVAQRELKKRLKEATVAPSAAESTLGFGQSVANKPQALRGGGRGVTRRIAGRAFSVGGNASFGDKGANRGADRGERLVLPKQIGTKTFYYKNKIWQDSEITEQELKKAIVLEQFSDDFFKLVNANPRVTAKYLTFAEVSLVKLSGKVYKIVPPAATKDGEEK